MHGRFPFAKPYIILGLLLVLSLPAVTTRLYASDEIQFYSWLRSWAFDRDADFENEYRHFYEVGPGGNEGFRATFLELTNEAGRRPNFAPIGSAILWAPFFGVGHVVALLTEAPADGYSAPYVAAIAYGSALYACVALLLTLAITRRVTGAGLLPTVAVWLGTPLFFYMYVAPGFSHACSAFAVTLFLWTWLRVRDRWTTAGAVALGAAGALMAMVREQDLFFLVGPAADFAWHVVRDRKGDPGRPSIAGVAAAGAASCLLVYSPQLLAYQALNGHPGPTELVARKMTWTSPHFFEVLLSPAHGLFAWTPLAAVGVAGLVWLAAGRAHGAPPWARRIGVLAGLMFVLQVYVAGSVESWTVAGSFGQRRFVAVTPLLALGLAAWPVANAGAWRIARLGLAGLAIWWNLGLMAQFGLHIMDRQRLSLAENARITFVELPRMAPALAWRYVTDRSSFFGLPRK